MNKQKKNKKSPKKAGAKPKGSDGKINIFISYSHDDFAIAKALREEIAAIDNAAFEVFLDAETIQLGSDWKVAIAEAVQKADIFIAIYTGNQKHVFDYCGFEVGLFTASERVGMHKKMFCIYDTKDPPTILSDLQSVQISYEEGEALLKPTQGWQSEAFAPRLKAVFELCYTTYAARRKAPLQDKSETKAREVIQAFYANKGDEVVDERPLHERLSITLPAVTDWNTMNSIPPAAGVMGVISSFTLLGVPGGIPQKVKDQDIYFVEWKDLNALLTERAGNVVPWIRYVEASILMLWTAPPPAHQCHGCGRC